MQQHWQAKINETLRHDYDWQPFATGSSNQLFKGISRTNLHLPALIARLNAPDSMTPGVNRQREAALLNELAACVWAPRIIHNAPEQGWCVMHYYQALKTPNLSLPQQQQLLAAITELQGISPECPNNLLYIDYHQLMLENYQLLAKQHNDTQALQQIANVEDGLAALPKLPACLVHHDLHRGNLALDVLSGAQQLIILDWEYSGLGNAWFDAAAMHRFLKISPELLQALPAFHDFDKHQSLAINEFNEGLATAIQLSEIIDALWYWARKLLNQ